MKFKTLWNANRALLQIKEQLTLSCEHIAIWSDVGFTQNQISFQNMLEDKLKEITMAQEELSEVLKQIEKEETVHVSVIVNKKIGATTIDY